MCFFDLSKTFFFPIALAKPYRLLLCSISPFRLYFLPLPALMLWFLLLCCFSGSTFTLIWLWSLYINFVFSPFFQLLFPLPILAREVPSPFFFFYGTVFDYSFFPCLSKTFSHPFSEIYLISFFGSLQVFNVGLPCRDTIQTPPLPCVIHCFSPFFSPTVFFFFFFLVSHLLSLFEFVLLFLPSV